MFLAIGKAGNIMILFFSLPWPSACFSYHDREEHEEKSVKSVDEINLRNLRNLSFVVAAKSQFGFAEIGVIRGSMFFRLKSEVETVQAAFPGLKAKLPIRSGGKSHW